MGAESLVSLGGTAVKEEIREVVSEERKRIEELPRHLQEFPQHPETHREDDCFVLLKVVPRETSYVPPGNAKGPYSHRYHNNNPQLCGHRYS